MDVWEVARQLAETADLLDIIGGDEARKAPAYRRAAHSISRLTTDELRRLTEEDQLERIPSVGPALSAKIREIMIDGGMSYVRKLRDQIPAGTLQLLTIPGLGPKTVSKLYRELGIESISDLEQSIVSGQLQTVAGLGVGKERQIMNGLQMVHQRSLASPLGEAVAAGRMIADRLSVYDDWQVQLSGDMRRGEEMVSRIKVVIAAADPQAAVDELMRSDLLHISSHQGTTLSGELVDGQAVELVITVPDRSGLDMVLTTGSAEHIAALQARAGEMGKELCDLPGGSEKQLYAALGLPVIPPELRVDGSEVETAAAGTLPELVSLSVIRGDLHVHSRWSHGVDDIPALAQAAADLGYEYVAICDHSRSLVVAGGLSVDRVHDQAEAIRRLNRQGWGCTILHGSEVDILSDGELDYPDELLEQLDMVVASVHSRFSLTREQQTRRITAAAANPHVDLIGHPTGRLLGSRRGYDVDLDAVIAACRQHKTMLEINASGYRLDLSAHWARRAVAAGVYIAINTDAHSAGALRDMELGVRIARRAGIPPQMVVNTWSLDRLNRYLSS